MIISHSKSTLTVVAFLLMISGSVFAECRMMKSLNYVPEGYHPVTVDWKKSDSQGDLVCISKTEGKEIRFTPWLDFPMPSGYYVLYEYPNPSPIFNGCKKWSVLYGDYQCINMYPSYQLRKS